MKKLLSIFAAFGVMASSATTVISCGPKNDTQETQKPDEPSNGGNNGPTDVPASFEEFQDQMRQLGESVSKFASDPTIQRKFKDANSLLEYVKNYFANHEATKELPYVDVNVAPTLFGLKGWSISKLNEKKYEVFLVGSYLDGDQIKWGTKGPGSPMFMYMGTKLFLNVDPNLDTRINFDGIQTNVLLQSYPDPYDTEFIDYDKVLLTYIGESLYEVLDSTGLATFKEWTGMGHTLEWFNNYYGGPTQNGEHGTFWSIESDTNDSCKNETNHICNTGIDNIHIQENDNFDIVMFNY